MKRLGKKKQGDIEPDLTSFSDIANLLIIFFILTTSLAYPRRPRSQARNQIRRRSISSRTN